MPDVTIDPLNVRPLPNRGPVSSALGKVTAASQIGKIAVATATDDEFAIADQGTATLAQGLCGFIISGSKSAKDGTTDADETCALQFGGPLYLGPDANLNPLKTYFLGDDGALSDEPGDTVVRRMGFAMNSEVLFVQQDIDSAVAYYVEE